jgi:hypothetical protein
VIGGLLIVRIPRIRRALLSFKHLGAHAKLDRPSSGLVQLAED